MSASCCQNSLALHDLINATVKLIDSSPEIASQVKKVRGGYLKIQGTWLPYDIARTLARRVAFNIRWDLVPLFGYGFPETCLTPGSPGFGRLLLSAPKQRPRGRPIGSTNRNTAIRSSPSATARNAQFGPQRTATVARMAAATMRSSYSGTSSTPGQAQAVTPSPARSQTWTFPVPAPASDYARSEIDCSSNASSINSSPVTSSVFSDASSTMAPQRLPSHIGHARHFSAPSFQFGRPSAAMLNDDGPSTDKLESLPSIFDGIKDYPCPPSGYVSQSGSVISNPASFIFGNIAQPVPRYNVAARFLELDAMTPTSVISSPADLILESHQKLPEPNVEVLATPMPAEALGQRRSSSAPPLPMMWSNLLCSPSKIEGNNTTFAFDSVPIDPLDHNATPRIFTASDASSSSNAPNTDNIQCVL